MTDRPFGMLQPEAYLWHLRRAADRIIALAGQSPTTPVPTCPEWTVRDLLDHLGQVHHYVDTLVGTGAPPAENPGLPPDVAPADWYASRVDHMLATFTDADPLAPCETFQPANQRVRYWFRRQAHEVAMHGVDIALAAGAAVEYAVELAMDGVGEVLDVWLAAAGPSALTAPLLLRCADRPEHWLLTPTGDVPEARGPSVPDARAAAEVRGPAIDLVLALWKRRSPEALSVTGDRLVARDFLASRLTP